MLPAASVAVTLAVSTSSPSSAFVNVTDQVPSAAARTVLLGALPPLTVSTTSLSASAVPSKVTLASWVVVLPTSVPFGVETFVISGATVVVSMMNGSIGSTVVNWLPPGRRAPMVSVYVSSGVTSWAGVIDHVPSAATVAVPRVWLKFEARPLLSTTWMKSPGVPVPLKVGVASLVIASVLERPVSTL